MEAIPIVVFWAIVFWSFFQEKHVLLYMLFASMSFGSFAAIPTEVTVGLTLTPTPLVAMVLIARELGSRRGLATVVDTALKPSGLFLLFLFWVVAGVATAFMPRLFAGNVQVVPVRIGDLADSVLLVPTVQNISQFVYVSISVLSVFAFASLLRSDAMRRHALVALCLGAAIAVTTGFLDYLSQSTGLESLLEVFRTASYALLIEDEVLGGKRVVGLMPEASAFGMLALSFLVSLYFFRRAMPAGLLRDRGVPVLMSALLLLIWLSTSSAAYLGLCLFGAAAATEWCWRLIAAGRNPYLRRGIATEFWLGVTALGMLVLAVLVVPQVFNPVVEMFDTMVLQKSASSSFEERGMWTRVSLSSLFATYGLGVGLGGTRASNFAVALASNTGVLGAACYFLFVAQTVLMRRAREADAKGHAFLYGMAAAIAGGALQRVARPAVSRAPRRGTMRAARVD